MYFVLIRKHCKKKKPRSTIISLLDTYTFYPHSCSLLMSKEGLKEKLGAALCFLFS